MKIRLLRATRVTVPAGEIVEVSPEQARFLLTIHSAEPVEVRAQIEKPEAAVAKRTTKRTAK